MADTRDQTSVAEETNPAADKGTDSEDNIPLSQLKQSCILLNQARRSLMKVAEVYGSLFVVIIII